MAALKPPSPLLAPKQRPLKPPSPLHPKTAPKTPISHPQRRRRFQPRLGRRPQRRRRFQTTAHLADRARLRYPWAEAGPGRATSGRPTLQTSSNQRDSNHLARTPVTNVVNLSPKTTIFSEKALGLTTFVTTRTQAPQKLNTRDPRDAHRKQRARLRCPWAMAGPGCGARGRWRGLAGLRGDAPSRRLAARTARGRAAAHGHTKQPGPTGVEGAGGTGGHGRASRRGAERSEALASRAAGPSGARNTSGATSNTITRAGRRPRRSPAPLGARNTRGATSNTRKQERRHHRHNQGKQKPQIPKDLRFHRARGGS